MLNDEIGKRIRKIRTKLNMTMNEFSEFVNISPSFLSDIELGKRSIRAENIVKICSKCNISCDYLLMGVQFFGNADESIAEKLNLLSPKYNDYFLQLIDGVADIIDITKEEFIDEQS